MKKPGPKARDLALQSAKLYLHGSETPVTTLFACMQTTCLPRLAPRLAISRACHTCGGFSFEQGAPCLHTTPAQTLPHSQTLTSTCPMALPPVPFSEPPYLNGLPSPYYSESHRRWQKVCREFISKNLIEHALAWEREEQVPEDVFTTFGKAGFLIPNLAPPLPVEYCRRVGFGTLPGGELRAEEYDYLHFLIYTDEVKTPGTGGLCNRY